MTLDDEAANPANPANPSTDLAPLAELEALKTAQTRGADGRFLTGNIGGGRPKGSKNRLTDVFISVMADDFAAHGAEAVARVRQDDPATYIKIVGSFVPRELVLQRETDPVLDLAALEFSDFMELLELAKRRQAVRRALLDAEPSARIVAK